MSVRKFSTLPHKSEGFVIWLYGLPSAGKTTLANALQTQLEANQIKVLKVDGDALRAGLCKDLGFSEEDRTENVRRAAQIARLAAQQGMAVIASLITPLRSLRELATEIIGSQNLLRVFINCPLKECSNRDVKGLYKKAQQGALSQMTGVGGNFEVPDDNEFSVETSALGVEECTERILKEIAIHAGQRLPVHCWSSDRTYENYMI